TSGSQDVSRPNEFPSIIAKEELAILVICTSGASLHVNLIVVVFTGILVQSSELQGVVALDPCKAVGDIIDRARRVRRIWAAAQSGKRGHIDCRNASGNQLALRENVGIVQACGSAVQEMRLIDWDMNLVEAEGEQNFVHLCGANGPHMIKGVGLIGAIEEFGRLIGATVQGLIFPEGEIDAAKAQALIVGQIDVNGYCVFTLVLRVLRGQKQVLISVDRGGKVRRRISLENAQAIRTGG